MVAGSGEQFTTFYQFPSAVTCTVVCCTAADVASHRRADRGMQQDTQGRAAERRVMVRPPAQHSRRQTCDQCVRVSCSWSGWAPTPCSHTAGRCHSRAGLCATHHLQQQQHRRVRADTQGVPFQGSAWHIIWRHTRSGCCWGVCAVPSLQIRAPHSALLTVRLPVCTPSPLSFLHTDCCLCVPCSTLCTHTHLSCLLLGRV